MVSTFSSAQRFSCGSSQLRRVAVPAQCAHHSDLRATADLLPGTYPTHALPSEAVAWWIKMPRQPSALYARGSVPPA